MKQREFDTEALHGGYEPEHEYHSRAIPIYQTVAHVFNDTDHAARLFAAEEEGHTYSRISNPTVEIFEKRIAALEKGEAALATSSGMSAIFLLSLFLASSGDEIVSSNRVYGGTFHLFAEIFKRIGIRVRFVETPQESEAWEKMITPATRFLYVETPANPTGDLFDLRQLVDLAHAHNLPLVVDSTLASPVLQQPLTYGADWIIHSATKYISGSGTALGGVIIGKAKLIHEMRASLHRDIGASLAPFHAWLFLLGLETLSLRMKKHAENALRVAEFLVHHPDVERVNYSGLAPSPFYSLVERQMNGIPNALFSFELKKGFEAGKQFINSVKLISHVANLGDAKTLAIHPASTTHHQLSPEEQEKAGITPGLVRISVGLEDSRDLVCDIEEALNKGA